ncbi:hypothetical protein QN277_010330 [Acacia crassicarpa]|uniref:Secreted protein n=1 Tax=Acacia crassicarpa TaxID=499986 RepID=A0AAE1M8T2_9FABA|nr:hypothetical protein QN277_010330 [Acacia crassicarpa]
MNFRKISSTFLLPASSCSTLLALSLSANLHRRRFCWFSVRPDLALSDKPNLRCFFWFSASSSFSVRPDLVITDKLGHFMVDEEEASVMVV